MPATPFSRLNGFPCLMDSCLQGFFFNWVGILSANIIRALEKAVRRPEARGSPLYFFGFLLDVLCPSNQFPGLKWDWTPRSPLVNIYSLELWKENYNREMYIICEHFLVPAHKMIFGSKMSWISKASRESISKIGNWYLLRYFTYIRIWNTSTILLPKCVLDRILLKEFTFQIFQIGLATDLIKRKVKVWPQIPLSVGPFHLLNQGHARKELDGYLDFRWLTTPIRHRDPKGYIATHFQRLGLTT